MSEDIENIRKMKLANNHIDTIVDTSFTIPVKMGADTFCTIHFIKHSMSLYEDSNDGIFKGNITLDKEIVASITLTRAHAEELSEIINNQLIAFDKQNSQG
ncbi:hypothetical protein [Klebsiella variicola]|uniref:hypothetical protein n=1 Tax=Klebsiella variicola TaxID=244366 RepID=UPI0010336EB9|nr:hypothetical protein [Klebsiella variicola]